MPEPLIVCHFSTSNMSFGNLSIFGDFFFCRIFIQNIYLPLQWQRVCVGMKGVLIALFCVTISKIGKFQQSG